MTKVAAGKGVARRYRLGELAVESFVVMQKRGCSNTDPNSGGADTCPTPAGGACPADSGHGQHCQPPKTDIRK